MASLATSVNELVSALPAINQQLLLLQQKQDAMEASSTRAAALRQPLGGAASTGLLDASAQISTMLQEMPPPRTAAPRMPQRPSSMLGGLQQQEVTELEAQKLEKPDHPSNDLAKAVLAQSNAFTALVGQIASMGGDSLSDLTSSSSGLSSKGSVGRQKLQSELAQHKGIFYASVLQAMSTLEKEKAGRRRRRSVRSAIQDHAEVLDPDASMNSISFLQLAASFPRWILAARTTFSAFLAKTFHILLPWCSPCLSWTLDFSLVGAPSYLAEDF